MIGEGGANPPQCRYGESDLSDKSEYWIMS